MSARGLLEDLRRQGVLLDADGERLIVDAPLGAVTDELRSSLAQHKQGLLKLLEWERRKLEEEARHASSIEGLLGRGLAERPLNTTTEGPGYPAAG